MYVRRKSKDVAMTECGVEDCEAERAEVRNNSQELKKDGVDGDRTAAAGWRMVGYKAL